MKRLVSLFIMFCILMCVMIPISASAASQTDYTVYINDKPLQSDYSPISYNNAVYIPLWSVIGHLNMSAEVYSGVLRINHPYRILLIGVNQNMMTYYGRGMDVHYTRLDYPVITRNDVVYAPLVFLSDYLDMQVAYGDDGRIDITAGDFSKNVSWGKDITIKADMNKLRLDADSEYFWSTHKTLWYSGRYISGVYFDKFEKVSVVGYSGSTVTVTNGYSSYNITFSSLSNIDNSFFTSDPLAGRGFSESIKDLIRQGKVQIGMTKEMAVLAWGLPSDVNKSISKNSYSEQWIYPQYMYLYFDSSGKLVYIQT